MREKWDDKRMHNMRERAIGNVTVTRMQGTFHIVSPKHEAFIIGMHALGGQWLRKSQVWSVPTYEATGLRLLITQVYGVEKVPEILKG